MTKQEVKAPAPELSKLEEVEGAAAESMAAVFALTATIGRALDESREKGDRAADVIALYRRVYNAEEGVKEYTKALTALKDKIKFGLLPEAYEREGISTLTTAERDRVTITELVRGSIRADQREDAYKWLRDNGYADLISETVNASTLSSFIKERLEEGVSLPEELFVTSTTSQASLTRGAKPKKGLV